MPIHPQSGVNSGSIGGLVAKDADLERRVRALEANRTVISANSITSTAIGQNSITTGHIQASAINATHISALAINATHIQALAIQTGHLAALAVTAEKIAANAIEADKIAASAVTTVKLDAGAVTAAKIAADTITSAQIAANAITASEIAADAVTATKIAANAVVAGKIAADAVTAATIAANSITSDKILAGAVTSSKITVTDLAAISTNMGSITAGTITGGTVQTAASGSRVVMDSTGLKGYALDGVTKVFEINAGSGLASFTGTATIQAGSVVPGSTISGTIPSASVPAIGGGNLLPDSSLEGSNASGYWSAWDGSTITPVIDATTAKYGTKSMTRVATGGNLIYFWRASTGVPVTPGERVTVSGWFKGPAGTSFVVGFRAYNGVTMLGDSVGTAVAMDGTWKRVTATLTIPATTTDIRYISRTTANATAGQQFWADALQMEYGEVATAYAPMVSEILPGTIVTSYLADGAVTTGKITDAAITTAKIGTGAVGTTQLADSAITAAKITDGTITTAKIGTSQITNTLIADGSISTAKLQANSVTANEIAAGAITANKLNVTVGGGNLQSDSSFESSIAAWQISTASSSLTQDATQYRTGTKSLRFVATGAGARVRLSNANLIPVTPSTPYVISAYVRSDSAAGRNAQAVAVFFEATKTTATTLTPATSVAITTTGWTRVTYAVTSPADAAWLSCAPQIVNSLNGEAYYIDDVQVEIGDVVTAYAPRTNEILPGTIVASLIAANTITSAEIAADAITSSELAANSVVAGKIAANAVTANEIAAGAVTTNKLNVTVGGGNLLKDSSAGHFTGNWTNYQATLASETNAANVHGSGKSISVTINPTFTVAGVYPVTANIIPVAPGDVITVSAWVKKVAGTSMSVYPRYTNSGAYHSVGTGKVDTTTPAGTWVRLVTTATVPSGVNGVTPYVQLNGAAGDVMYVDDLQVETGDVATAYAPKTDEILPGTIIASMIAADTITASQIAADAISSNELASNAVIAGKISAGAINAANLFVDGVITASKIETGTITATQIGTGAITSNVIAAGAITAQKLSLTAGGGNLIAESSFENVGTPGTLPPGIVIQGTGTTTFPNDGTAYHGTRYLRHVWTGTGILKICAAPVYCRAGVTYAASLYVRGVSAGGISSVYQFTSTTSQDGSTGYVDGGTTLVAVSTPTLSTSWQRYTATFTVATDRWVQTGVRFANVAAGDWAEIDAIQVEEGSTHTAYNHRLPGSLGPTQILPESITSNQIMARTIQAGDIATGTITANEILAGTITADKLNVGVASSNQVVNSSFENSTSYATGWTLVNATGVVESTIVHGTGKSAKVTPTIASGHIHIASGSRPTCDPGQAITASAWVYVGSAVTIRIGIRTYDAVTGGSATGSTSYTDVAVPANTWTRITTTRAGAAVPAGTKAYDIYVQRNTDTTVFYVDDVQGQVGDLVTAYSPKADEVLPGTIQAQHLSVATLDAISANMGNLTAGTITGATVRTAASGARVELSASDFTLHGSEQQLAQYPYFVNESGYWALIRSAWGTATWANQIGYTVGDDFLPGPSFAPVALPGTVAPGDILTAARIKDINSANVTSGAEIIQTIRVNPSTSYKVGGKLIASRVTTASPAITVTMEWLDSSDNVLSTSTPTPTPSTLSRIAGGVDLQQWNLITNPSAEVDTSGWTSTGTTLTRDNAWASVGTYSLRTTKASVTNNDVSLYSHYVPWEAGAYLSARAVIKAHNAFGGSAQVGIEWWDATSLLSTTFHTLAGGLAAGATYTFSPASAAPANTTRFRLRLAAATSGTQNVDVAWDAIRASGGAITGYADGNTSGWSWTGTAGASASTGFSAVSNDWTAFSATATSHASAAKLRFKVHVASATGDSSHETHFYGMYAVAAGSTYAAYKLNPADGSVLATSRLDSLATENVQSIAWRDLSAPAGELAGAISGESGGINETAWLSNYTSLNVDSFIPSTYNSLNNRGAKAKLRAVDPRNPDTNHAYIEAVVSQNSSDGFQSNALTAYVASDAGLAAAVILKREDTGLPSSDFEFAHQYGTSFPTSPRDGQTFYYVADQTNYVVWHMVYDAGNSKWMCVGGVPLINQEYADYDTTSTTAVNLGNIGTFSVPKTGTYMLSFGARQYNKNAAGGWVQTDMAEHGYASLADINSWQGTAGSSITLWAGDTSHTKRVTLTAGRTLKMWHYTAGSTTGTFGRRWFSVLPVALNA